MFSHLPQAIDGIWVDVRFWFRPLDYLIMRKRRSRPQGSCPINRWHTQNFGLMLQCQSLRGIEQILELFEVCVPENFQVSKFLLLFGLKWTAAFIVVDMNNHQINFLVLQVEYSCLYCEIQLLPQVLEDFFKVSIVGDLHIVEFQSCPFDQFPDARWACRFTTLHQFPCARR